MAKKMMIVEQQVRPDGRTERVDVDHGMWVQLGKGPTSVAHNTAVIVLSGQVLAAGEIPVFYYGMKSTPTNPQRHTHIKPTTTGTNDCSGFHKKTTSGNWEFVIKHEDGAARDFDWQACKITPV